MTPRNYWRARVEEDREQARRDRRDDIIYAIALGLICAGGLCLGYYRLSPLGIGMIPLYAFQILFFIALAYWGWRIRDAFAD